MKTLNLIYLYGLALLLLVMSTALKPPSGDECDPIKISQRFKELDFMGNYNADCSYSIINIYSEKKIAIRYLDREALFISYDYASEAKIVKCTKDFLEVVIIGKEKKCFLFVKGVEIRTLVPEIKEKDNFRVKTYEEKVYFEFEGGKYYLYNFVTRQFCPKKEV